MLLAFVISLVSCNDGDKLISSDPKRYEFQLRVTETELVGKGDVTYTDLDSDGNDERILVSAGENPNESLILVTTLTRAVINQVTLPPTKTVLYCFADDINDDKKKDLFVAARERDTVVAYVIDIFNSKTLARFSLLSKPPHLATLPLDATASMVGLVSHPKTSRPLVICVYNSSNKSMNYEPRGIAAFDVGTGTQEWFFLTAAWPNSPIIKDINADGRPEIFLAANSPANGATANGRNDLHCYLFALSTDGTLLWERNLGGRHSGAAASIVAFGNGRDEVVCTYKNSHSGTEENYIARLDAATGDSLWKRSFDEPLVLSSGVLDSKEHGPQVIACSEFGTLRLLNRQLEAVMTRQFDSEVESFQTLDIVGDEKEEVVVALRSSQHVLLNHELEPLALIDSGLAFSVVHQQTPPLSGQTGKSLALQAGGVVMRGRLEPDPVSSWRWALYFLLVAGAAGTIYGFYRAFFYLQLYLTISRNTSQLATIVLARNGRILHVNDAAVNLLDLHGILRGRHWTSCFDDSRHETLIRFLRNALGGAKASEEFLHLPAAGRPDSTASDNHRVTMLARLQPILSGRIRLGSLIVLDNLTEVVRWASIAQSLAHEMKTPLSTIWFTLERMRQQAVEDLAPALLQEHTASISEELRRLDGYIKGFMKLANLNPPNLQTSDLNTVLDSLVDRYSRKIPSSITIQKQFQQLLPSIKLDVNLFTAAVTNLLDNAVCAMKGTGLLRVSTSFSLRKPEMAHELGHVCVAVADSGPGIAEEDVPRVFTPYFSRAADGTGLGLTITKKIAEEHGGTIDFRTSRSVGTEFVIRLPVSESDGNGHA